MRCLFVTQNRSLHVFHALHGALHERRQVDSAGYVIADSWNYLSWLKEKPGFEQEGHLLLKEWEITAQRHVEPDFALLRRYERELGDPNLFKVILSDRRLSMGPHCAYSQDDRRRFSDRELLSILQGGLVAMDKLFEMLKPDLVMTFICVTFLDYLAYLFARARGVKFLNIRFSRISDRMIFGSTMLEPSPELVSRYEAVLQSGSPKLDEARAYLSRTRESNRLYEGVFKATQKPIRKLNARGGILRAAQRQLNSYREYRASVAAADNHVPDPMVQLLFTGAVNPLRAWWLARKLAQHYYRLEQLEGQRFAFFPLHAEPEISLLVYGRPYLNQLEVVRAYADALPVDMCLVVKEHPWMIGRRKISYYDQLLSIPRVKLAHPGIAAADLIKRCEVVTVVTGSASLETVIFRKPAVTLGHVPFNVLPRTMVLNCPDLTQLPEKLAWLIAHRAHDEEALEAFIASLLDLSESIHWYTTLLGREEIRNDRRSEFAQEIATLAEYTLAWAERRHPGLPPAMKAGSSANDSSISTLQN